MIVVVDYEMGNLRSIVKSLEYVGGKVIVSYKPDDLLKADKIVLPGVGAFRDGMANLQKKGLDLILYKEVKEKNKPLMGICLGMQLLADKSYEFGEWQGLSLISGEVKKFNIDDKFKIPHVGWNNVKFIQEHKLLDSVEDNSDFYFAHSYYLICAEKSSVIGVCDYGGDFTAIVAKDNIFATQFHPEKSQKSGLKLLENFVKWKV